MIKRPRPSGRLRRGAEELLERRGMMAATDSAFRPFGPMLHARLPARGKAAATAGYGSYAALSGQSGGHQAFEEQRAHTADRPAHPELKGHRHRGAERHSAH
jgi:hypothetical protein